jgi:hypothetical protein
VQFVESLTFRRNILPEYKSKPSKIPEEVTWIYWVLLGLLFDPEDGGSMVLQNIGLSELMVLQHRRLLFIVTAVRTSNPV